MMYPLVRDLAADGIAVAVACRVLGFSKQAYFKWGTSPVSQRDWDDAHLVDAAKDIHAGDPEFGHRLIADELREQGIVTSDRRVRRLCSANGIAAQLGKGKGSGRKAGPPVHDDLIRRDFHASKPNEKWLTDITEHPTAEGKLYMCSIKDCYDKQIVGYSIGPRMKANLAVAALRNAITLRGYPQGTIVHSDRGSQFRSKKFVGALTGYGLKGSMGRVGAAGDNAAKESFYALLQRNVLDRRSWTSREQLRLAIVTWIERTYHRRRRQTSLGKHTPIEFATINKAAYAA